MDASRFHIIVFTRTGKSKIIVIYTIMQYYLDGIKQQILILT